MLELVSVSKKYRKNIIALDNVSIKLPDTGLVFLSGDSGSGKSTLLNIISTLEIPTTGEVLFNEKKLVGENAKNYLRNDISIIFQDNNLFENLTVYDNLNIYGSTNIDDLLKELDISELKKRLVKHLSGGEKRRVSIGRAILKNPKVLLCDEPDASLDEENRENIYNILKKLSKNMLVIVSSHDAFILEEYADRVITIQGGKISDDKVINKVKDRSDSKNTDFKINKKFLNIVSKDIIFANKIGFTFAVIILSFFVTIILLSGILSKYNFVDILVDTLQHENDSVLFVNEGKMPRRFSTGEVIVKSNYGYEFGELKYLWLNVADKESTNSNVDDAYYSISTYGNYYVFTDDFLTGELIGNKPTKENEIVLYELAAESIIRRGVYLSDGTLYKTENIEDLFGKELMLGDLTVSVSGIIKQDLEPYKDMKNEEFYLHLEGDLKHEILASLFYDKIKEFASYTLVTDEFFNYIEGHYEEEALMGEGGLLFESDKNKQKEYLKEVNPDKNPNLYTMLIEGGFGGIGVNFSGTTCAYATTILTLPYLFGQAIILFSPILIVIMVYVILMYFENVYKKNRQKFAVLTSLGLTGKNMNKVYSKSLLIYFGISSVISCLLVLMSMVYGNVWLSNFVGFYLHPFRLNMSYLLITIGIVLFTFVVSYMFLRLRVKKRNAIMYLKNN